MINTAGIILLIVGVVFNLFGCIGLIRLPDVYNRLQSATKCVTLGTCSMLLGVLLNYGFSDSVPGGNDTSIRPVTVSARTS